MDFTTVNQEMKTIGMVDVDPDKTLVEKALNLDINYLDNLDDSDLTKYIAALSQYNIFISLTYNKHAVLKSRMSKALDVRVFVFCKNNKVKKSMTKADKLLEACTSDDSIALLFAKLEGVKERLRLLDDTTKHVEGYVNALKKDLMRRRIEFGGFNKS